MRQTHVAGEKLFVDYAGATLEVISGLTGEVFKMIQTAQSSWRRLDGQNQLPKLITEPPRVLRRLVGLSQAAMARSSRLA